MTIKGNDITRLEKEVSDVTKCQIHVVMAKQITLYRQKYHLNPNSL